MGYDTEGVGDERCFDESYFGHAPKRCDKPFSFLLTHPERLEGLCSGMKYRTALEH
jgi:hypothetical protein